MSSLQINIEKNSSRILLLIILSIIIITCGTILFAQISDISYNLEAEGMHKTIGITINDETSKNGLSRFASMNQSGYLTYGPYITLPKGDYTAFYRIKSGNIQEESDVALLDVYSKGVLNQTNLDLAAVGLESDYRSVPLTFSSDGEQKVEFRVYKYPTGDLYIDSIKIIPLDSSAPYGQLAMLIVKILLFLALSVITTYVLLRCLNWRKLLTLKYLVFLGIFIFYLIVILGFFHPLPVISGDEKHYLLASHSVIFDGDLDLKNNYENKDYLVFHKWEVNDPHVSVAKDGAWLPTHGIGLSLLLVIPYLLCGLIGAQIFLAIIATLVVVSTFFLIREFIPDGPIPLISSVIVALTSPLLFYSHTIYPETVAALILSYTTLILLRAHKNEKIPFKLQAICGLSLAIIPILGLKYIAFLPALVLFIIYYFKNWRDKVTLLSPLCVSSLLYGFFLFINYGTISPIVQYTGLSEEIGMNSSLRNGYGGMFSTDYLFNPSHVLTYFFSQEVGLFFYAPIYMVSIIGLIYILIQCNSRNSVEKTAILILPSFLYFLTYAGSKSLGGWCPPSRPLVAILPVIAVLMALGLHFCSRRKLIFSSVILTALSVGISYFLLLKPSLLISIDGGCKLLEYLIDTPFIVINKMFPTALEQNTSFIGLMALWLLIVFGMYASEYQLKRLMRHQGD